ncbi:hypothetical protein N0V82_008190 [Gnomoniopsis sp. IMI 355080]|nr:hypothetical protein N0V82_008190 [Gnomoniopsis sp. IMI 355080]
MSSKLLQKPHLNPSSTLILVTGASGYIASNIVKEALELGYHVRGTARTQEKCDNTIKEQGNHPNYSTAIVSDFSHPSAEIDNAVKGVDSVIHVASDTSFSEDADKVISSVVQGTENFLRAAAKEPKVKRFTLTSSSTAALLAKPGVDGIVATTDTWDDEAVDHARNKKGQTFGPNGYNVYAFAVYAASKTEGERALWNFVKKEQPSFVTNAVLPNFNVGRVLGSTGGTGGFAIGLLKEGNRQMTPQYFIDVIDDSRLHLCAAVLDESLKNERIFAFATPFNANDTVDAIKRVLPTTTDTSKLSKDPNEPSDLSKVPNELGAKLLKKWFGQDGYKSLDQSVKENLQGI